MRWRDARTRREWSSRGEKSGSVLSTFLVPVILIPCGGRAKIAEVGNALGQELVEGDAVVLLDRAGRIDKRKLLLQERDALAQDCAVAKGAPGIGSKEDRHGWRERFQPRGANRFR